MVRKQNWILILTKKSFNPKKPKETPLNIWKLYETLRGFFCFNMYKFKMLTKAKLSYVQWVLKPCLPVPKQLLCTFLNLESIHAQDTFPDIKQCKVSSVQRILWIFFITFGLFGIEKMQMLKLMLLKSNSTSKCIVEIHS